MIRKRLFAFLASLALILAPASFASTISNTTSTPVSLTIGESASLSLSANVLNLSTTSPSGSLTITTSWVVQANHYSAAKIYSWFSALPTCGSCSGTPQVGSVFFSTQFNGGAATQCTQPAFGTGFGHPTQNCGVQTLSQNPATDTNDSVQTQFTLNFTFQQNTAPTVGSYTNGTLVLLLVLA